MPTKISLETREAAIAALEQSGDVAAVAEEFGISKVSLRNWRNPPQTLEHSASDTAGPAHHAALEFCAPWPHLAPHEVVEAGHRTLQEWLETVEKHAPRSPGKPRRDSFSPIGSKW